MNWFPLLVSAWIGMGIGTAITSYAFLNSPRTVIFKTDRLPSFDHIKPPHMLLAELLS